MATIPDFPYTDEFNGYCNMVGCPNKHIDDAGLCETCYLKSIEEGKASVRNGSNGFKEGPYKNGALFDEVTSLATKIANGNFSDPRDIMDAMARACENARFSTNTFYWISKLRKAHPTVLGSNMDHDFDTTPLPRRGEREDFHADG